MIAVSAIIELWLEWRLKMKCRYCEMELPEDWGMDICLRCEKLSEPIWEEGM